eukprot:scaffold8318_cov99-Isochrysis_galbana.AAC.2
MSAVFGIALAIITLLFFARYDETTVLREGELERLSAPGAAPGWKGVTGCGDGAGSRSASHSSVGWGARSEGDGWWARARAGRAGRSHEAGGLPTSNAREI